MVKKILIDARMYGLENAGIGRYLMNLVSEIQKIDKENDYIILLRKKYFDFLTFPSNWKKVLADFRHYTLFEQIKLPILIKREKPDLVHFPHFNVPVFFGGKFIVTIHDLTMQRQGIGATALSLPLYLLKRVPFLLVAKKSVKRSVKIVSPSNAVASEIVKYYGVNRKKIGVIYEGVSSGRSNSEFRIQNYEVLKKYKITRPYFIYVGNAYPHKNLKRLVEAILLLNRESDNKILLAIGGSRDIFKKRLEIEINKMGANKFVKLLGYIDEGDLTFLYKNSVAFVYPSLAEGFGLQGLEALSAGTLVLASDIRVFREIYDDNAIYFNPYDFSSLATRMKGTLQMGSGEREKIIAQSKKFVERYSWVKMAEKTHQVYEEVLRKV